MKKSFILLITIVFVTFIIGIAYKLFLIDKKEDFLYYKNYYQSKIFLKDILKQIFKYSKYINDKNIYRIYQTLPIFIDGKTFLVKISPYYQAVDINNIKENNFIYKFMHNLLQKNGVKNPKYFLSILLDTIDKDSIERNYKTEIALYKANFIQGHISKRKLKLICNYYYKLTGDNNIFKINFYKYIAFENIKEPFNYLYISIYFNNNEYMKLLVNWKKKEIRKKEIKLIY